MADGPGLQPQATQRRPGRKPLSKRQRRIFAITLGAAIAITVVAGAVLALTSGNAPEPRATTLPAADRHASAELIAAAEAVGYSPQKGAGVGTIEDGPAESGLPPSNPNLLPVGTPAPAFTLKTPTGEEVSLSDFRGKALLLEIFATWCPHCAAEAPHLRELAESLPGSDYAFVSINGSGEDAPSIFAYHAYFGLPFPALLDPDPQRTSGHIPRARLDRAGVADVPDRLLPDLLRDRPGRQGHLALRRRATGRAAPPGARARRRPVAPGRSAAARAILRSCHEPLSSDHEGDRP